jgi:hypothetical protein
MKNEVSAAGSVQSCALVDALHPCIRIRERKPNRHLNYKYETVNYGSRYHYDLKNCERRV